MPNLRRGRIVQFVMAGNSQWPGRVFPAIVVKAHTPTNGTLAIVTEDGFVSAPSIEISETPERGKAFFPDTRDDAVDVDFVPGFDNVAVEAAAAVEVEAAPANPPQASSAGTEPQPEIVTTSSTSSVPGTSSLDSTPIPTNSGPSSTPADSEPVTAKIEEPIEPKSEVSQQ